MRGWSITCSLFALTAAGCGQMYGPGGSSGSQQQPAQPGSEPGGAQASAGPPGAGADPWATPDRGPGNAAPSNAAPSDPYGQPAAPQNPYAGPDPDPDSEEDPATEPAAPPERPRRPRRPPAPPPPAPPPPAAPPPAAGKLSSAAKALLDAHNGYRAQHCARPLTWSPKLAAFAQDWANKLRDKGCMFGHSGGKFGENLAAGTSGTLDAQEVVAMWYDEVRQYSFKSGGFSMQTGHFTQLVWRGTSELGCAISSCNGTDIWVCEYDPPGNVETQYRANVLPKGC